MLDSPLAVKRPTAQIQTQAKPRLITYTGAHALTHSPTHIDTLRQTRTHLDPHKFTHKQTHTQNLTHTHTMVLQIPNKQRGGKRGNEKRFRPNVDKIANTQIKTTVEKNNQAFTQCGCGKAQHAKTANVCKLCRNRLDPFLLTFRGGLHTCSSQRLILLKITSELFTPW